MYVCVCMYVSVQNKCLMKVIESWQGETKSSVIKIPWTQCCQASIKLGTFPWWPA